MVICIVQCFIVIIPFNFISSEYRFHFVDDIITEKKKKNSESFQKTNNRNETKTYKHCLEEYKNIRIFLLKVLTKVK